MAQPNSPILTIIWRLIACVPLALPVGAVAFGAVAIALLLCGQLHDAIVWPLGGFAAGFAMTLVYRLAPDKRPGTAWEQRLVDCIVIVGVIAWAGFNTTVTAQHILTNRDPAAYALAGVWLSKHEHLRIERPSTLRDVPGIDTSSAGFVADETDENQLYVRGPHLLPVFLGLAGRIGGPEVLFAFSPVLGGLALLAMYGFVRLLVRPRWALLAVATLAGSLPLLYFSRDTYTEPLFLMTTFSALAMLGVAIQARREPILWVLAGMLGGAGMMVRIDGLLMVMALLAWLAIAVALRGKNGRRAGPRLLYSLWFVSGMAVTALLGWFDLVFLTGDYFVKHLDEVLLELTGVSAIVIIGGAIAWISWRSSLITKLQKYTKTWRGPVAVAIVMLVALVLASRPLWYASYTEGQNGVVAQLQAMAGHPIEPRNYAEQTVNWLSWYIGAAFAVLGALGAALVAYRVTKRRPDLLLASFLTIIGTSLLYLIRPNVVADQIWASRRLLPVIMPGFIIFGVILLAWFGSRKVKGVSLQVVAITIGLASAILPFMVSLPFLTTRTSYPHIARVKSVCEALPPNAVLVWFGSARTQALQATKLFCDIPTAGYGKMFSSTDAPSRETLQHIAASAARHGWVPVAGVYASESLVVNDPKLIRLSVIEGPVSYELEQTLFGPPQKVATNRTQVALGVIRGDGTIRPLHQTAWPTHTLGKSKAPHQ